MMKTNTFKNVILAICAISIVTPSISNVKSIEKNTINTAAINFQSENDLFQNSINKRNYEKSLTEKYGTEYEKILKSNEEAVKEGQIITSLFDIDTKGNIIYPDYLGGIYISEEGKLTLQIIKEKTPKKVNKDYTTYSKISSFDKIDIKYVDNSYNELDEVNSQIVNYFIHNNKTTQFSFVANYIDTINNRVVVELSEINEKNIEEFKNSVVNSDLIEFKRGTIQKTTDNLNPGSGLGTPTCSMGYRAKLNGKNGFVTAGHCFRNLNIGQYGTKGELKEKQMGQKLDAAFIETFASVVPTNTLEYSNPKVKTLKVSDTVPTLFSGQVVMKEGSTTKFQSGTITQLNWSGYLGIKNTDITFYVTDFIQASNRNEEGDSGGPVFDGQGNVIGITSAGIGNSCKIVKASNIKNAWNVTRY